jgi:HAD superfamily hydrolase (TIGR01509 family)
MFSAIFWDNDGVLMETEHLYYRANVEALAGVGVRLTMKTFREISLQRGESVLDLAGLTNGEAADLRRRRDIRYRELLGEEAQPFPGVEEVLATLRGKLPMAIVTSCRRENFLHMHRRSGLLGYFDFVLTREDYCKSKPDPEPYLTACGRAALPPGTCLAVEDSERGVTAAATAGLAVVAIPGEMNREGNFSAARWRVESMGELAEILKPLRLYPK